MKPLRYFLSLLILGVIISPASFAQQRQTLDLKAELILEDSICLNQGDLFHDSQMAYHGPYLEMNVYNLGPETFQRVQNTIWGMASTPISNIDPLSGELEYQIFPILSAKPNELIGSALVPNYYGVNDVKYLLDIEAYKLTGNIVTSLVARKDLIDGEYYGFFFWVRGLSNRNAFNPDAPINIDNDQTNNFLYIPVRWHCEGTHYTDMEAVVDIQDSTCINEFTIFENIKDNPRKKYGVLKIINKGSNGINTTKVPHIKYFSSWQPASYPIFNMTVANIQDTAVNGVLWSITDLKVEKLQTLINIDNYKRKGIDDKNTWINAEHCITGEVYGLFLWAKSFEDVNGVLSIEDTIDNNNFAYVPIKWDCDEKDNIEKMIHEGAKTMRIFPNPAQNDVHIHYTFLTYNKSTRIEIMDMTGRLVFSKEYGSQQAGTQKFTLNTQSFTNGNYIVKLINDHYEAQGKLSINR